MKSRGRPISPQGAYARKLGITTMQLRKIGGMERCMKLTDESRSLLLTGKKHS